MADELLLANIVNVPISPYNINRANFLTYQNQISNDLQNNVSSIRIDLLDRIVADYQECYSTMDEQYSLLVDILIVGPGCGSINSTLLNIFNTGIAACDACFASVIGSIFPPFSSSITDAETLVAQYQGVGTICIAEILLNPGCYNATVNN